jgi:putative membrane protein
VVLVDAHVGSGALAPLQLLPATVSGILYALRAQQLRGTPRAVPGWRQAAFYAGLLVIVTALASPLGHLAGELFLAHMGEHLLIADVGALLLVLGVTGPVLAPLLRLGLLAPLRVLSHPVVAFGLWTVNLFAWHVPALHEAAVRHEGIHALQHAGFVGCAFGVWMALFGPLPTPAWFGNGAKAGYILAVRLVGAVLANVFLFGGHTFYDVYARGEVFWAIAAGADQSTAGAIMMVWESLLTIGLFCWLFLKAAREGEERQALLDLAGARGVTLTPERAARAVGAGRGAELRRRIEAGPAG